MKSTALTALLAGAFFTLALVSPASATVPSCPPELATVRTYPKPCPSVSVSTSASTSASASSSVSASASVAKSLSQSTSPAPALPVTGPPVGLYVIAGTVAVLLGAFLFLAARRRRVVFKP